MANPTWFDTTNMVLRLASLDDIPDVATFGDNSELEKYQFAAKHFVLLANQHLSARCFRHFASRRIQLPIVAGQNIYQLDTGISPENISFRSFFNETVGAPASNQNRELRYWDFYHFERANPQWQDGAPPLPTGAPTRWSLLPIDRANDSTVHKVLIYPMPDQGYTLGYRAKLNAHQLVNPTDPLLFPPEYVHAIWEFCWDLLERDLGEGKEGNIGMLAEKAAQEVQLVSGKLEDAGKAPRTMKIRGHRNSGFQRYYNSPQSIDGNGNVID